MLTQLNKRSVQGLPRRAEPYEVRDNELKGFLLRIEPGGTRSWFYEYRLKGQRNRVLLGRYTGLSPDGARNLAKIAAGDVAKGINVAARKKAERNDTERARLSTLDRFLERYEPWEAAHRKVKHGKRIRSVFPTVWLSQPLSALDTWKLESWRRDPRKEGKKATTINRDIAALTSVLSKAVEWGLIERSSLKLKPLRIDPIGRVRFLTAEEEKRLRSALTTRDRNMRARRERYNKHLAERNEPIEPPYPSPFADHVEPLILLLLNTGMRFGEATHLQFRDVNLKDRLITVAGDTAKSGRTRVIPMNLEAHRVLSAHRGNSGEYVFPGRSGEGLTTIKKAWQAVRKAAAILDFRLHDLRHSFASRVKRGGADLYTVQRLLGHSSPMMTQRYAHLQPDDLRAAVETLAR